MLTNCETVPVIIEDDYISISITPEFPEFSKDNPELLKILDFGLDMYSVRLKDLISAEKTGLFISSEIENEIKFCMENIEWIGGIIEISQ